MTDPTESDNGRTTGGGGQNMMALARPAGRWRQLQVTVFGARPDVDLGQRGEHDTTLSYLARATSGVAGEACALDLYDMVTPGQRWAGHPAADRLERRHPVPELRRDGQRQAAGEGRGDRPGGQGRLHDDVDAQPRRAARPTTTAGS